MSHDTRILINPFSTASVCPEGKECLFGNVLYGLFPGGDQQSSNFGETGESIALATPNSFMLFIILSRHSVYKNRPIHSSTQTTRKQVITPQTHPISTTPFHDFCSLLLRLWNSSIYSDKRTHPQAMVCI